MSLNVDDFKARLIAGGARANLFKATLNFPAFAAGDVELASFMCKAASLPASTISTITVPFRGRQIQVAGDRTFEAWTITVINDGGMEIRNAFERWMNGINQHEANLGLSNPLDYQVDMAIEQLNRNEEVTKRYDMRGVFPTNVSAIDVSNESENTIEEFTVELQIQYWTSDTTS
jgi:hypothetical protein